jgi:hypothetical protein
MTMKCRVANLEADLRPKELVVRWMREAHAFGSYGAYSAWLRGQPHSEYPLVKLPAQIYEQLKAKTTHWREEEVQRDLHHAYRELLFHYHLHGKVSQHLAAALPELQLKSVLLTTMLKGLMFRLRLGDQLRTTSLRLERAWPYPLDPETARAVAAAENFGVETWEVIGEAGTTGEWLDEQLRREGRTQLPLFAGLVAEEHATLSRFLHIPTKEEIHRCFADEACYESYLAGENYHCGFADVTDQEYEERLQKLDAALHDLVASGQVEAAAVLCLDTIPCTFLQDVPMVEGELIDEYALILAEWGALRRARGFSLSEPGDDHLLAFCRVLDKAGRQCEPGDPRLMALFDKAKANLASFPGTVTLVGDRPYLSLNDYLAWPRRGLKGDLRKMLSLGFRVQSFNAWVKRQGEQALLAGVAVAPLDPWAGDLTREVVPAEKLPERLRERREILSDLAEHDLCVYQSPMVSDITAKDAQDFVRDGQRLAELLAECQEEVAIWIATGERLSRRYFSGEDVLYPASREELATQRSILQSVDDLYRDSVAPVLEQALRSAGAVGEDTDGPSGTMVDAEETVRRKAKLRASIVVVLAKAAALDCLGEKNDGIDLIENWVRRLQD